MSEENTCMKCDKPATTKITKISDFNRVAEILLCDEHAQQYRPYLRQLQISQPANLVEIIQHFFKQEKVIEAVSGGKAGGPVCPNCGLLFMDYRKTLLLGCSDCYEHFEELLLPDLRKIHGAVSHDPLYEAKKKKTDHSTKTPLPETSTESAAAVETLVTSEVQDLDEFKSQLDQAIEEENYERAAQLRDKIRGFENQLEE